MTISFEPSDDLSALVAHFGQVTWAVSSANIVRWVSPPSYPNVLSKTKETPPRCNRGDKQGGAV